MIVEDTTKTYDDFEPYVGGKPSPNPEYPQEIKAVVNPVIKTHGKNLLKATLQTNTQNGVTCINNGDGTYTLNGIATALIDMALSTNFHIENGKMYRMTGWVKNVSGFIYLINGKGDARDTGDGVTFTYNDVTNDLKVIHIVIAKDAIINNVIIKPMICTDINATYDDFEPYQETQATLPYELYAIPVDSGGNVTIDGQQYIADYVDVEHGKLVRKTHVTKFTGAENWVYIDSDKESSKRFGAPIQVKGVPYLGLSNYVINANKVIVNNENAFSFYGTWVDVRITKFISVAEFKNFLSEINSSGKPMIVIYALVTPEEVDLTPEAIEAFKALYTYYPKTYINAESEQLSAYTMFNYPVSMEKGWEYVKQQLGDTRKYVYDMDTKLTETEASTLEAKIDTAILSEMVGG